MNALPGCAAAIGQGFAVSLGQCLLSPWMIPVVLVAVMVAASLVLRRWSRRTLPLVRIDDDELGDYTVPLHLLREPVAERPPCPWCTDVTCLNPDLCNCKVPCGRMSCIRAKEARRG